MRTSGASKESSASSRLPSPATSATSSCASRTIHSCTYVSFHDHGDDEVNPIASTTAFAHFQDGHGDRRQGGVDQQTAQLVGAYITTID
jgi:hypothetical protein